MAWVAIRLNQRVECVIFNEKCLKICLRNDKGVPEGCCRVVIVFFIVA